jgi:ferredoxin-NADP reductase
MKNFLTQILDIQTIATDTKRIIFEKPAKFEFKAGQFLIIKFTKKLMRAYSIASTPSDKNIELVIRIIPNGQGTTIIDAAKIGDEFTISNGMGHFLLSDDKDAELYFFATGTGIAPFKSMIRTEAAKKIPRKMYLFYGGRKQNDLAYWDELSSWAKNLEVKIGLSREKNVREIIIPNLKTAEIDNCRITKFFENKNFAGNSEFYICGNKGMVDGTKEILLAKGIDKSRIFFEKFN